MSIVRLAAVALVVALAGCGERPRSAPVAAADIEPVRAAPVESARVAQQVRAVGVLTTRDEIRLAFKVGGVIDRMAVDTGDQVRRGQLLAMLKSAEVDASVAQVAEAAEKAHRDLERARRLRADEVATEEQVQDLTTAFNVAHASLEAARFNARFARIEAPVDGVVLQRLAEKDELVQGGQPVLVVGATSSGWVVRTALADRDVVRVRVGAKAEVSFDAFPGEPFAGKVTRVAGAADPQTGSFDVEVEVTPGGARFVRGLVAKVTVGLEDAATTDARSTAVPLTALVDADGATGTVFILDAEGKVAHRRRVSVGAVVGDRVIVHAGLEPGQRVVTEGAAWLTDGRAVRVVDGSG
ncbi:MAG TPA: efflux RND transporter periplasmic adaptor subunit [Steroidobacteraceae bacterium]|nr:efflux RND transporter periplasmic adaptor subunit [Steroidobacteraceae bacterium]